MANLYRYFHRAQDVEEADTTTASEPETGYESDETVLVEAERRPPTPLRYREDAAEINENAWDEAFDRQMFMDMIGDEVPPAEEEPEIEEVAAPADPPDQEIQLLQVVASGISDLVKFYEDQQRLHRQADEEPAEEVVILGRSVATQTVHNQQCECPFCPNL